jgi:hypothetical protein
MGTLKSTPYTDVWAAFVSGKPTLIPTDFWLDDMSVESVAAKMDVDDYCNLAILVFARIVNLLASPDSDEEEFQSARPASSMQSLWDDLQKWRRLRPPEVCPLLRDDSSPTGNVFPMVVYSRSSSSESSQIGQAGSPAEIGQLVCGNTFYHTGSILLLQRGYSQIVGREPAPSLLESTVCTRSQRALGCFLVVDCVICIKYCQASDALFSSKIPCGKRVSSLAFPCLICLSKWPPYLALQPPLHPKKKN